MHKDKYPTFKALEAAERRGEDYEIAFRHVDRAPVVIIAPHGGNIEPLTDHIADQIAGRDFSFYAFRGLRPGSQLHITSSHFDEPQCTGLVSAHDLAVSIHGWGASGEKVCIGGRDTSLIGALKANLLAAGISVEDAAGALRGTGPQNIVNRCASTRGVQLELTMSLRKNAKVVQVFVGAVRVTLLRLAKMKQK